MSQSKGAESNHLDQETKVVASSNEKNVEPNINDKFAKESAPSEASDPFLSEKEAPVLSDSDEAKDEPLDQQKEGMNSSSADVIISSEEENDSSKADVVVNSKKRE